MSELAAGGDRPGGLSYITAFKIGWRESRASSAKFLFVILAIAAGVGSLTGVRGFSRAFRDMLLRDARVLMAGDVLVRVFDLPNAYQTETLASLEKRGVRHSWITETVSMMSAATGGEPVLVSVKAVDPKVYPFYGTVRLEPSGSLADKLDENSVAVSDDMLFRLSVKVGDTVKLGGEDFRLAAVVAAEPDRMSGSLNVGPRVMISRAGLDRTRLLQPGSRASQRFLFKIEPNAPPVAEIRGQLRRAFPQALISDYRETEPRITSGLDRATMFLSLASLVALIVAAIGVATAIESHLQQKLDSIAVMKSLGARSSQIMRIYLAQSMMLALIGGALGLVLGAAVEYAFPALIAQYFPLRAQVHFDPLSIAEGFGVAILCTLLFTLPPLLSIRRIRPAVILRREMAETKPRWKERWRNLRASAAVSALIIIGIGLIAAWLAVGGTRIPGWQGSLRVGGYFAGGVLGSLLALSGFAWLLLRVLRIMLRTPLWKLPGTLRHGVANLYRPGNHAAAVLVALGMGVTFTLTIYLVQHSVLATMAASAPKGMPNVFLLNITEKERADVMKLLANSAGLIGQPGLYSTTAGRLLTIDGEPIESRTKEGGSRRYRQSVRLTWDEKPQQTEVVEGAWWTKWDPATPEVSVAVETAKILGIKPGARLEWMVSGRKVAARVAALHRTQSTRPDVEFILTPGVIEKLPMLYFGGVRMEPKQIPAMQRAVLEKFPQVTVINVAEVIERVQEVVDQIALVIRFISAFAVLAGAIILASSIAGTRFRRVREVVILKTLGATRRRVARIFSVEFLILGVAAGVMGGLLATGFSSLLLKRLFDAKFQFDVAPNLVAVALTATLTNAAGWLVSYRILRQKPLEALREE